jgi:hypothetical protein
LDIPQIAQQSLPWLPFWASWLDFTFVDVLAIANPENKDILFQYGIDHPVVTDATLSKPSKLALEHRIGFRLFDQFVIDEFKNSFRLRLR